MSKSDKIYWPFIFTEEYRKSPGLEDRVRFLETVTSLGYKGYRFGTDNYGAESTTKNSELSVGGRIIQRSFTKERWELQLFTDHRGGLSAYLSSFKVAADALVDWLQGESVKNIVSEIESHLIVMSSRNNISHTLYPAKNKRSEDESQ